MFITRCLTKYAAPQVHRPWVTSSLAVLRNRLFFPTTSIQDPTRGNYKVAFLSQEEMQKLADYNFTKFLKDFKPPTSDKK